MPMNLSCLLLTSSLRLSGLHRHSRSWRHRLFELLELLEALNRQLADGHEITPGVTARTIALVHAQSQGTHRRLALLIGQGEPANWRIPLGCTLMRTQDCSTISMPDFYSPPLIVEVTAHALSTCRLPTILLKINKILPLQPPSAYAKRCHSLSILHLTGTRRLLVRIVSSYAHARDGCRSIARVAPR